MKLLIPKLRILDIDIENRPLSYMGNDFTTGEPTVYAASFGVDEPCHVWILGVHEPEQMLAGLMDLFDKADMITGHYIRAHDLPYINGALLDYDMPPINPILTSDTKLDLMYTKGISCSQESLSGMLGIPLPKVHMTQENWRQANRLVHPEYAKARCTADVRQHQLLRARLLELHMLGAPQIWTPERHAKK